MVQFRAWVMPAPSSLHGRESAVTKPALSLHLPVAGRPEMRSLRSGLMGIASDVEELARSLTRINQQEEAPHA